MESLQIQKKMTTECAQVLALPRAYAGSGSWKINVILLRFVSPEDRTNLEHNAIRSNES
jgi:hypothetical protein